jgi:hypothetical protein
MRGQALLAIVLGHTNYHRHPIRQRRMRMNMQVHHCRRYQHAYKRLEGCCCWQEGGSAKYKVSCVQRQRTVPISAGDLERSNPIGSIATEV